MEAGRKSGCLRHARGGAAAPAGRRRRRSLALCALAATWAVAVGVPTTAARATTATVVSLTFDDGPSSHAELVEPLGSRGMAGTFFVSSGKVGTSSYYMTWPQVRALASAGNEIGGHTIDHARLPRLSEAEMRRQVCGDRDALARELGVTPTSFAYPYGDVSATVEAVVRSCYESGRALGGVKSGTICRSCPYAEGIPPRNLHALRTLRHLTSSTPLSELKGYVTGAEEHGGGWVILVFHGVCDNRCTGTYSYGSTPFVQFLDWLRPRTEQGTVVRTVGAVVAGLRAG